MARNFGLAAMPHPYRCTSHQHLQFEYSSPSFLNVPLFMPVPLLDLNAQNLLLEAELKSAFERVLRSSQFILGPEIEAFENKIAQMIGVKHALSVSSGTDAILLALMALGVKEGDEVICPTYTFFATAGCIARAGATPVFADSCEVCFNIDPSDVEKRITPRTKAIMPVHLFGQTAEMEQILALGRKHGIPVIEDAAQALGSKYQGQSAGTMGLCGTFSFFPSKNLGGFGDSGMLVSNDDAFATHASLLRTHGANPKYYHKFIGGNFRMDPLQAALIAVKLPHYDGYTSRRQANAAYYAEHLSKLPGVAMSREPNCTIALKNHPETNPDVRILLPSAYENTYHIWNQFTLRVRGAGQRDALRKFLTERKIGSEIYYPIPMHRQECFSYLGIAKNAYPVADLLASEAVSIPIYPELSTAQKDEVIEAIGAFLNQ